MLANRSLQRLRPTQESVESARGPTDVASQCFGRGECENELSTKLRAGDEAASLCLRHTSADSDATCSQRTLR